jgi:hypothetical protein
MIENPLKYWTLVPEAHDGEDSALDVPEEIDVAD